MKVMLTKCFENSLNDRLKNVNKKGNTIKWIICKRVPLSIICGSELICIFNNDLGKMQSLLMTFANDKILEGEKI